MQLYRHHQNSAVCSYHLVLIGDGTVVGEIAAGTTGSEQDRVIVSLPSGMTSADVAALEKAPPNVYARLEYGHMAIRILRSKKHIPGYPGYAWAKRVLGPRWKAEI